MQSQKPKIGGHVSTAGGLYRCFESAHNIGAEMIQIFGSSARQWKAPMPGKEEVKNYHLHLEKSAVGAVYLHAPYLINLASPEDRLYLLSIDNLTQHFQIAEMLGARGLIFHVGSGKETSKDEAMKKAIVAMKTVLSKVSGSAKLIMENSASNKKLGATAKEMGTMLNGIGSGSERVKICLDTAHAFEAGLIDEYSPAKIKTLLDGWHKEVGIDNIVALHVNDSKTVFNSNHDRHENIGEGHIGLAGFKNLAGEERLHDKDWVLEVPGFEGNGPDKKNMEILKSCFV